MPDRPLSNDPAGVRAGLRLNPGALLEYDFDTLPFAHAQPMLSDGRGLPAGFVG
jgi:hypothetical protein